VSEQFKSESVSFSVVEDVATIMLNRPDAMNAMTPDLMRSISGAMEQVKADQNIRVVVVTGSGRGFCAGADLSAVANPQAQPSPSTQSPTTQSSEDQDDSVSIYNNALRAINSCPVPTIARVNGPAAGGGFGLALACDVAIAAHSAFFVATFGPRLGIVPDMGATWSIPQKVGRARALGITLLGERIRAQQAQDWGLIWSAVPDADLDAEVARVADILRHSSPATVTRIRQTIDAATHNTFSDQLDLEMEHQAVLIPRNMQAAAQAFMDKREPTFGGERD